VTDYPEDRLPAFCARCDRPIKKDQPFVMDHEGMKHKTCYDDQQRYGD